MDIYRENNLKIVSWNVAGLRAVMKKSPNIFQAAPFADADIICIQETKLTTPDQIPRMLGIDDNYDTYWAYSNTKKGYSGTAMFIAHHLRSRVESVTYPDNDMTDEGRLILLKLGGRYPLYIMGAYVPNSGQKLERLNYRTETWDEEIRTLLSELNGNVIYCGDLNIGHDNRLDMYKPSPNLAGMTKEEQAQMTNLLNSGFVDIWRNMYPEEREYTYWSFMRNAWNTNRGYRLDYFLCNKDMYKNVLDIRIINESQFRCSDHCPIMCIIKNINRS